VTRVSTLAGFVGDHFSTATTELNGNRVKKIVSSSIMMRFLLLFALFEGAVGMTLATNARAKNPTQAALEQVKAEEKLLSGFRLQSGSSGATAAVEQLTRSAVSAAGTTEGTVNSIAPTCDVSTDGPICLNEGKSVILPPAVQPGVIGYWSFDQSVPLDGSGNNNHGATETFPGPSPGGSGTSAYFRQGTFLTIPNSQEMQNAQDFSYTFWIYLVHDASTPPAQGLKFCPILRKGIHDAASHQFSSSPALLFDRETRRLRASVSTSVDSTEDGEYADSLARLSYHQWMHIALVHLNGQKRTRLYVNGILDKSMGAQGYVVPNDFPLYVGGDPWSNDKCDVPMYVDELRAYNRPLSPDEIQAEASPALTGVEPSFVRLACNDCTLDMAVQGCPAGYHVCTSLELHAGAYQVARSMGWLSKGTHVWTHATVSNAVAQTQGGLAPAQVHGPPALAQVEQPAAAQLGLGMCCADSA